MPASNKKPFPKDFLWGASVSGHQVEGGNHDQWTRWEEASAGMLAETAERRIGKLPIWPEVKAKAREQQTYISGRGVEHYQRYREDFDLLNDLNLNSFRLSIEWARLEPQEGQWDEKEVAHYHDYIAELRKRGIEPVLNVWHWTHPVWFEDKGGFTKRSNLIYFERFVAKIAEEYGPHLKHIITINEPNVYTLSSFFIADYNAKVLWPPAHKNFMSAVKVYLNLLSAHKRAYKVLKRHHKHLQIGVACQLANIQARDPHDLHDEIATKLVRYVWNWWFLHRIRKYQDFVGINYYFTDYYNNFKRVTPKVPVNDLGWYMEPEGLYPILLRAWAHYKKPIIITENGVADAHDQYRRWWIEETLVAMERAISQGVVIKGYFHWSLLDNFEWAMGWLGQYGLVAVDRQNGMKRTVRQSAKWYAEQIKKLS